MSTKPPSGTRDFLPDDIRRREYVIGVVRDVYERYGFGAPRGPSTYLERWTPNVYGSSET